MVSNKGKAAGSTPAARTRETAMQSPIAASIIRRLAVASGAAALSIGLIPAGLAVTVPPDDVFVPIAAGKVEYYSTNEALRQGQPVAPPRLSVEFSQPLRIMKRHVSQAEYAACVADGGCRPLHKSQRDDIAPDMPVVGVSWQDATDYAAWLGSRGGHRYRLPTYAEWVHAAGEAFTEDLRLDIYDPNNPATRWLAEYALEAQRKIVADPHPKPFGTFGANKAGVQDTAGNVWDWTDTCYGREYQDADGKVTLPPFENCGVRVVAGSHHSMITDFMRDPKAGACSVGIPPANLGIRLVRE